MLANLSAHGHNGGENGRHGYHAFASLLPGDYGSLSIPTAEQLKVKVQYRVAILPTASRRIRETRWMEHTSQDQSPRTGSEQ